MRQLLSPFEAVGGAIAARDAFKAHDPQPARHLYAEVNDGGFRAALVDELAIAAPRSRGPSTPFDSLVDQGDPFWRLVRGRYQWRAAHHAGADPTTWEDASATKPLVWFRRAAEDLMLAAAGARTDDVPCAELITVAIALRSPALAERALREARARNKHSWAALSRWVFWLSANRQPIDEQLEFARRESQQAGDGEVAALPLLAHAQAYFLGIDEPIMLDDRAQAARRRDTAERRLRESLGELNDACARSVDRPGGLSTWSAPVIRHHAAHLYWRAKQPALAKAQLSKVGLVFVSGAGAWAGSAEYEDVLGQLGL